MTIINIFRQGIFSTTALFLMFCLSNCSENNVSENEKKLYGKWTEINRTAKCSDSIKTISLNSTASAVNYSNFTYEFLSSGKVLTKTPNTQDTKSYKVEGDTLIWDSESKSAENIPRDRLEFISPTKLKLTSAMPDSCIITSTFEKTK